MDINRQYGDHLYEKGDYDGAMNQYIKTLGHLEASYVIRMVDLHFVCIHRSMGLYISMVDACNDVITGLLQFLDASRIHNLTAYLQALHKQQLATVDHTTLLLNCYTKLKMVDQLDEFIMVGVVHSPSEETFHCRRRTETWTLTLKLQSRSAEQPAITLTPSTWLNATESTTGDVTRDVNLSNLMCFKVFEDTARRQ